MDTMKDHAGLAVSGATADGLVAFERAAYELRCLVDDPVASIDAAIAAAPAMPMAHLLKAWLMLLGTEPAGLGPARECVAAAAMLPANERERGHLAAATALVDGRWFDASRLLEDVAIHFPHDALALQAGHQIDFFTGRRRLLRDRIARALPHWSPSLPGYHALLGMHAFGLEENGDYDAAERQGQRAVEREPRDSWAWHAVAHVHEMRNAPDAGIAWLGPHEATWSAGSFLGVHNHWHLALFHLERDEHDVVLARYDAAIGGPGSAIVLDLIDASAMLWRLQLRGVDVGDRWQPLAERWLPVADAGNYAFNDLHAMLAFVGAGHADGQQRVLAAQQRALHGDGDNRTFTAEVGDPAVRAVHAFGAGDPAQAVELLRPIREYAYRFGGSHAQRDLLDLTLIEAALRSGDAALAAALTAERSALRPRSPLAGRFAARAQA
ncbi:MAG: tetratricopeptide repeat protein, partial [Lautropia sp.]